MVFIREGFIAKQIKDFETINSETICVELTINKRKWCILFAYRPPNTNKHDFFSEISISLNKMIGKYDNIVLAGDLNIDDSISLSESSQNHLSDMKDVFSLTNLIKEPTCFKSQNGTLLDLILTNRPRSFMKSQSFETGLSDCHKLVCSILRASFKKLPPKIVKYRDNRNFNQEKFLQDLDRKLIQGDLYRNCDEPYQKLSENFIDILNFHAPLKEKHIRGNHAPFMTKELSKAIMEKSKARNKYLKWPSRENYVSHKKSKNKCNSLTRKAKKLFFKKATKDGIMTNKKFWSTVKPFLTNKGCISNDFISIEKDGELISNEKELVEIFNENYINIVEKSSGKKPSSIGDCLNASEDVSTVKEIIARYSNHPSIQKIKNSFSFNSRFELPKPTASDINKIIKSLDTNKATGPDGISAKYVKISANIIDSHLSNIISYDLSDNQYSEHAKTAAVRPCYKKDDRTKVKNYRPVSLLNIFSKIYERFLHENLTNYVNSFLSKFISAYRKSYSSNHVLLRLIENWKKCLDEKKFVGAVLMDLSKAFDSIPHDLLIAKMYAYGFSIDAVTFFYSYLKRRNQSVKINNTHSVFQILLSGVPQGSILGPLLFNIFINDLYLWITKTDLLNFADDNTISAAGKTIEDLILTLETDSQKAIEWFKLNEMIVNPDKFQAIIVKKNTNIKDSYPLKINDQIINSESSVKLLGIEIDNKLSFDKHISTLCKKASNQLNAIGRIQNYMGFKEKEVLINSFVYSNFNYCPLVWHFCSSKSLNKIEKIQERALRLLHNDFVNDYSRLLEKSGKSTMTIKRLRCLALEIFKTLNDQNPNYMKEIFSRNTNHTHRPLDIKVNYKNTTKFGINSLRSLGPHIWNSLPKFVKEETNFEKFKEFINDWFGLKCKCNMCKFFK